MAKTVRVIFDGEVLRPEGPIDLKPNARYSVTIASEEEGEKTGTEGIYPLTEILKLATDVGVTDLSTRHSWYAHRRLEDPRHGT